MLLFRALLGAAMAAYIVAVPTSGLDAIARIWTWYATVDAVAALVSTAMLPLRDARFTSVLLQAVWSIGAALTGFFLPARLLLTLFVAVPLWSVGSTLLAVADLQQVRVIEARWLIAIVVLAAATFAAVFLVAPVGDTTWVGAALAAGGVASSVLFLLTALSVKPAPQL